MLRIYICPECFNYRMVSRKPDAICFHCGNPLNKCDIDFTSYMNMTEEARSIYKENFKSRIMHYQDKLKVINKDNQIHSSKEPII